MQIINNITDLKKHVKTLKAEAKKIGFVPTMGCLHCGHLSLVSRAKEECDIVIMSIFVNEKQFGPNEDFTEYPRDFGKDSKLAEESGIDILFVPKAEDIYEEKYSTYVDCEGQMANVLCAKSRSGHFKGVCTIVTKLFNITSSDINYFGQKDYQQALILQKMVSDLNMNTEIKIMPIAREKDGLALSSRNIYLSQDERNKALSLNRALNKAREMLSDENINLDDIKKEIKNLLHSDIQVNVDYVEILDASDLAEVTTGTKQILVALAVYVGKTRLIDNIIVSR